MSAAGPPQGANRAPAFGGSAAAPAASVGVHVRTAGPPQDANWPCRPRRCETQRLLAPSMPAQAGMEPRRSASAFGGSAAAELANEAASVGAQ
jgi:hypothetical protein